MGLSHHYRIDMEFADGAALVALGICLQCRLLVYPQGLFGADRYCLPIHKIQRVTFSQSWVMAKAGLASLKIQLASGSYSIPMIDAQIARQLQSYILNKVEVEAQPWM